MSITAIALLAAIAALLVTAVIGLSLVRSRRTSQRQLTAGLREVGSRLDDLAEELRSAVERVREDALRTRIVESLGQALDLPEVLARCADAAAALHGVAGAVAEVEIEGAKLTGASGEARDRPGRSPAGLVGGPPDGRPVRAVGISYHYAAGTTAPGALRSAIAVPLESEGRPLGFLAVFGHSEEPPVTGNDFATLEAIARHTGPAIERARRRGTPQERAEADPLTSLRTRQALHETLALEVARAHRSGRPLAVCLFDLDGFRQLNERLGQIEADGVLTEVAALLRETLGPEDTAYRSGGDAFAVIMPGGRRIDGEALCVRLRGSLGRASGSSASGIGVSAGLAELKPDDDGVSLFERAERMLRRGREGTGTAA
jgi:diguanylate cyclase (GGDEF)-like protein